MQGTVYLAPRTLALTPIHPRNSAGHPSACPVRDLHNHVQIVHQLGGWLWGRIGHRLASRLQK
jgi:hypothetical protein